LIAYHLAPQAVLQYYWRRAARIVPAFWVSLLLTHFLVLRARDHPQVPEAAGALLHYPAAACSGQLTSELHVPLYQR
jgi:peptidoglycan/LPS O-acetylase OafA/YrhL